MLLKLLVSLLLGWSLHLISDHTGPPLHLTFGWQMETNQALTIFVPGGVTAPSSQKGNIGQLVIRPGTWV